MRGYFERCLSDREKARALIGVGLLVLMGGVTLWLCSERGTMSDLKLYYSYASFIVQGKIPYRDFPVEYPPLALVPILLPQLMNLITSFSFIGYLFFFTVQSLLIVYGIGVLIFKLTEIQNLPKSPLKTALLYGFLVVGNLPFLLWRYDAFPTFLTLLALWLTLTRRPALAGIALGFGIAAKLYPVLLIPSFVIYYWVQKQNFLAIKFLSGATIAPLAIFLLFSPVGLENLSYFLSYHQFRGIQIESLASGLLLIGHLLQWIRLEVVLNYGAFHLQHPWGEAVIRGFIFAFLIGYVAIGISYFKQANFLEKRSIHLLNQSLIIYILITLLLFILTNKVFSPQYLVWLLPFVVLLPDKYIALFAALSLITFLIYPASYGWLIGLNPVSVLLLNCRNFLAVGLLAGLIGSSARLGQRLSTPIERLVKTPATSSRNQ